MSRKRLLKDDSSDEDDDEETTKPSAEIKSSSKSSALTSEEETILRRNLLKLGGQGDTTTTTTTTAERPKKIAATAPSSVSSSSSSSNNRNGESFSWNNNNGHNEDEAVRRRNRDIEILVKQNPDHLAEEVSAYKREVDTKWFGPIQKCVSILEVTQMLFTKVAVEEYQKVIKPLSEGLQPASTTQLAHFYIESAKYIEDRKQEFEKPTVPFWAKMLSLKMSALCRMRAFLLTARKLEVIYSQIRDGAGTTEQSSYYNGLTFRGAVLGVNAYERSETIRDINMKLACCTEEDKRIASLIPTFENYAGLDLFHNIIKITQIIEQFKNSDALRKEKETKQSSLRL